MCTHKHTFTTYHDKLISFFLGLSGALLLFLYAHTRSFIPPFASLSFFWILFSCCLPSLTLFFFSFSSNHIPSLFLSVCLSLSLSKSVRLFSFPLILCSYFLSLKVTCHFYDCFDPGLRLFCCKDLSLSLSLSRSLRALSLSLYEIDICRFLFFLYLLSFSPLSLRLSLSVLKDVYIHAPS